MPLTARAASEGGWVATEVGGLGGAEVSAGAVAEGAAVMEAEEIGAEVMGAVVDGAVSLFLFARIILAFSRAVIVALGGVSGEGGVGGVGGVGTLDFRGGEKGGGGG